MRKGTILNPELGTCHLHIARSMKQGSMLTKSQTGHSFVLVGQSISCYNPYLRVHNIRSHSRVQYTS